MTINAAVGQLKSVFCNIPKNVDKHISFINEAKKQGADIIVFPELSLTGYTLRDAVLEVAVDPDNEYIRKLALHSEDIIIIAGIVESGKKQRCYNTAVLFENCEIRSKHRKVFLPTYGMFEEGRYFSTGDDIKVHETSLGRIGIIICEDAWYPELVMKYRELDIDLLVIMAASPVKDIPEEIGIRNKEINNSLNRFHARNLEVPAIFANKTGYEQGVCFWGGSSLYSSKGEKTAEASTFEEELIISELDFHADQ
ncbi:nitrilase-related carbon-nitrogen hydrolase [candidate division KSB1 bacterium]